tara:strand:- start:1221 stop:1757 length:537 start_codon:yes stop_codon:yes gene_type:complete
MSILKIAKIGHPILLKKGTEIKDFSEENIKKIIYDMSETMIDYNGIGLAAPQIHISKRIIIFRNPEKEEKDKIQITALINPTFKPINNDQEDDWEGCLSIPGMQGLVRRFKKISYSGYDINGNKIENLAEGLHARVVQHEIDHLNGVLYTERLADNKAFGFEKEIIEYWKNEKTKEKT